MRIAVAFVPDLVRGLSPAVTIVVDVLRATTTLTTLCDYQVVAIVVAGDLDSARASRMRHPEALLLGEEGGLRPDGFDAGNSPREFTPDFVRGRNAICRTSNGTNALRAVAGDNPILLGCVRNATAVTCEARSLAEAVAGNIAIVCSGTSGGRRFALDDALVAGLLVERLTSGDNAASDLDDAAHAARALYRAEVATDSPAHWSRALRATASGRHLDALGLASDIDFCAVCDATSQVPRAVRDSAELIVRPGCVRPASQTHRQQ